MIQLPAHLCYNCFQERETSEGPCPYCGFDLAENEKKFPVALRAGTVLNGRYIVGRVLGQGGFGITYLALDTQLNAKVAIKEFMPGEIATRQGTTVSVMMDTKSEEFAYGAERFQEEARTLAKFIGNPNIAAVTSYFDENDTSYFVMDYIEGISFKTYIANHGGKISVEETLNVMIPVLRALTAVHAEGFIHRDVTPDNIYITKDGMVKLLDFGSARYSIGDKSKSLDVILKVGYAPKEQYIRRSRQGPFTDVYSCAACFYAAITGFLPPESLERMDNDTLVPVSQCGIDIPEYLDKAILKGLAVQPEDRFQSAAEFLDAIESQQVVEVPVSGGTAPVPEKKKIKPALIAGLAAVVVVAVGIGIAIGGGGGQTAADPGSGGGDEDLPPLVQAEVPSITIAGQEYSTDLRELELSGVSLSNEDIVPLKYMVNLTALEIRGNLTFDQLEPLSALTNLETLTIVPDGEGALYVSDLSPLSKLTNLKSLNITINNLSDFAGISGLTELRELDIWGQNATYTSLDGLENLTKLESLRIPMRSMDQSPYKIDALAGLTSLKSLNLSSHVKDLAPLENLTNLEFLSIENGGHIEGAFSSLEPLKNLTSLTRLSLYMETADLTPLTGLTKLQSFTLYAQGGISNQQTGTPTVTNLSAMENWTELRELTLVIEYVTDISPLRDLKNLQSVTIIGGQITDWSPVEHVPNVTKS